MFNSDSDSKADLYRSRLASGCCMVTAVALIWAAPGWGPAKPESRFLSGVLPRPYTPAPALGSMPKKLREEVRGRVHNMITHAWDSYTEHAFPLDELTPITCRGEDTLGGIYATAVDSLDTLAIIGNASEFTRVSRWLCHNANWDRNTSVSVFETNIRAVGGLLSAHLLASDPKLALYPGYGTSTGGSGCLLDLAESLAQRLMPAFSTRTGIPFGSINLAHGVASNESRVTSTAAAGTFMLEFGVLSALTNNTEYERAARRAVRALMKHRSRIGLLGSHINVDTGSWTVKDAGVGANSDSFYEYLLKAQLAFDDDEFGALFQEVYETTKQHLKKGAWWVDVHMDSGQVTWPVFNSLAAFWPGLQVLAGDLADARKTLFSFFGVWRMFRSLPEGFNLAENAVMHGQEGWPLRPELAESTYVLYRASREPSMQWLGLEMVNAIEEGGYRKECGYAGSKSVVRHAASSGSSRTADADRQHSYFLAETLKYLYLLFDEDNAVMGAGLLGVPTSSAGSPGDVVLTTEGHVFPTRLFRKEFSRTEVSIRWMRRTSWTLSNFIWKMLKNTMGWAVFAVYTVGVLAGGEVHWRDARDSQSRERLRALRSPLGAVRGQDEDEDEDGSGDDEDGAGGENAGASKGTGSAGDNNDGDDDDCE